ncbi:hypothetical protein Pyn_35736 [Prunus yedoensis var. nudiflora]|uniref:Uncharacterized protein n=1 Tax=Prunus yedoensis var. nudiflora TaxID=2094558 RepID=A0A314UQY1_PRUYE|nr:hypothetical protein Pyn_35736 [Prunus yedoensis var. nudiflora]
MERELRVFGSSPSSGNESTSPHSLKSTLKSRREVSLPRAHCIRFAISFLQDSIRSDFNSDGNPPSGNDSSSGHSVMSID